MVSDHPAPEKIRSFAQGLLAGDESQDVESHLEQCDSCCALLARQSENNTLVELVRQAVTAGFGEALETPAPATNDFPPELKDHPRYQLLAQIGRGGMGAVYKAEHRLMQRIVALKVVHPSLVAHPTAVQRFRREVRVAAKLSHPHIVAAFDADQAGDVHFLVMEYVDGLSLDRWIAKAKQATVEQACRWMRQAALALQHAHEQGMAHRDIKPHNLMLTRAGAIKILDFGLTRFVAEQAAGGETWGAPQQTTREGAILGTPDYIAPEQITDSGSADIRSDIYSLGCTLYHLLAGRAPYAGRTLLEKLHAHGSLNLPPLAGLRDDVPRELLAVLARMTAKDPRHRYATPREVADALAPWAAGKSRKSSEPTGPATPTAQASPGNSPVRAAASPPGLAKPGAAKPAPTVAAKAPAAAAAVAPSQAAASSTPAPAPDPSFNDLAQDWFRNELPAAAPWAPPGSRATSRRSAVWTRIPRTGWLAAGGAAAVVAALFAVWGIWNALGEANPELANRQANVPPRSGAGGASPRTFSATPPGVSPGTAPSSLTAASAPTGRLLLVLPSRGLWYTDYSCVVEAVQAARQQGAAASLTVAGTTLQPSQLAPMSQPGEARPTVRIGQELRSDDYDAVIFVGADTSEYLPGGQAGSEARRLIADFQARGKIVASLCAGQRVLADHGALYGKRVAACEFVTPQMIAAAGGTAEGERVVRDGAVVTASRDVDAADLLATILRAP